MKIAETYYYIGRLDQRQNNFDEAIKHYCKAIEINPNCDEFADVFDKIEEIYFVNPSIDNKFI